MRFKSAYFLASVLIAFPALAQNYSIQEAPKSWNMPTAPATDSQLPEPIYVPSNADDADIKGIESQSKTSIDTGFEAAVSCAATLQIMALAAPDWSNEEGVANSSNLWLARAFATATDAKVKSDKVTQTIKEQMQKQTNDYADNLEALSNKAFNCAANPPL